MFYSLSEAADEIGKSKMTIQRAIKGGKLSAGRDDSGAYQIDPAELHRVFPEKKKPKKSVTKGGEGVLRQETEQLRREIEVRDERIERLDAERRREREQLETTIDDLRKRLDTESAERQRLTLLITDQRAKEEKEREEQKRLEAEAEAEAAEKAQKKRGLFGLLGASG